jgi:hypothetical protein
MKKLITTLCLFVSLQVTVQAQVNEKDEQQARSLINSNFSSTGLSKQDLDNFAVTNSYYSTNSGLQLVYITQTFKGIPVFNQVQVMAFKEGTLVSNTGGRIPDMDRKVNMADPVPQVDAIKAVSAALAHVNLTAKQTPVVVNTATKDHKLEFGNLGVSRENITAQLLWVPDETGTNIRLAWQVYVIPTTSADYWMIRMDAVSNNVISKNNLTVYCNWNHPAGQLCTEAHQNKLLTDFSNIVPTWNTPASAAAAPFIVNGASYRVIPFPAESPIHAGGAHALRTNPWTLAGAGNNAISLNWHSTDAVTDFNITRGNNVWAKEDQANNNGNGAPATSTTGVPLTFNFTPNFTVAPTQTTPVPNQQFNITNLFYWNNIIHDITYQYGFNEASGNFQANNLSRGGLGNDFVLADAQDGGGTNNANFSTPVDGGSGRMQMYLWTGTPQIDGDVDNGVIVHEYGHGISNRLTGGPGNSSCLGNAEQMGEGWSDYYALMYTQNWAASNLNTGFTNPRGIGTYALGQPTNGLGIRTQRYCTDFTVNNRSYAASISASPHTRGEIWAATLWDMTWNIINQTGVIDPNIYNAGGNGGNTIALRLVTEGLRLQPCSPGFIDGRDAILAADNAIYGGAYRCAIVEAFRRRGMGDGAAQGSSANVNDQVPTFIANTANCCAATVVVSTPVTTNTRFNATGSVTGSSSVTTTAGGGTLFNAGTFVMLNPGFVTNTSAGGFFLGRIASCTAPARVAETRSGQEEVVIKKAGDDIDKAIASDLNIYPNPARDVLYIRLPVAAGNIVSAILIDAQGKTIPVQLNNNQPPSINIKQLPAGSYYLKINTKAASYKATFVKQ